MKKALVYKDEKSNKFWDIEVRGSAFTVTYGKLGTAGSSATKSFGSEAECQKEAQKLINEKLKKGYQDGEGSSTAVTKDASPKKESKVSVSVPNTYVSDFAKNMQHPSFETFDPQDLIRFQQGFPEMVILMDKHPHNKAWEQWVVEAAGGIDPTYETEWPSRVALAYAHTYPVHPGFDATGNLSTPQVKEFAEDMQNSALPTVDILHKMLKRFMPGDKVYSSWKAPAAFYAMENYLGAETVALAIVERFTQYTKKQWEATENDYHSRIALEALGYLMLRATDEGRSRIQQAVDQLKASKSKYGVGSISEYLDNFPDSMIGESAYGDPNKFEDPELTDPYPRTYFLHGADILMKIDLNTAKGLRKTVLQRWIDQEGRIKHPGVARVILSFGRFRAVVKDVKAWKEKHAEYVDSIMHLIEKDPLVQQGLQGLEGKVVEQKNISSDKAWQLTEKQYDVLRKGLKALKKEKTLTQEHVNSLMQKVVDECREIARSAGEDYLELFFVELWPEADWDDFPEEVFEMLSEAYEEVVC
jgi:predicted DNA-binding WGR domain protein